MPAAPDGTGDKTPPGKGDGPSRRRWLKKPAVWVGALVTAVITGVLINLVTGVASQVGGHGGAAPNIEVDSVSIQYLPPSPQGTIRARPVKIDLEVRNTGNQLAIIRAAKLTVQQFAALPTCFSAGALVSTGTYSAFLPTNPSSGKSVEIPTAQQVGPDAADRFDITVGLPRDVGAIYIYRVRIELLYDNSSVPAGAGEAVIALPVAPYVDFIWTKQEAAHPDRIPPVVGGPIPEVSRCLLNNSRKLHGILAMAGVRPAQLTAVQSQLSTCCGWTLPVVKAQQTCGPALDRPAVLYLSCDGTGVLENMKWSTWAFSHATGTGILRLKNCIPSCANGKARDYNVTVHFDMPTQTAKSGWLWDRMTFYFPDSSPYGRSTVVQSNLAA